MGHHTHLSAELLLAVHRGEAGSRDLVDALLQRLGELCTECAEAIATAESTGGVELDAYDEIVSAALAQHRQAFARPHGDPGSQARRLAQLRDLPLAQRLLWIENASASWTHPTLGEQLFVLAREALPLRPQESLEWARTARALAERYPTPHPGHRLLALAFEGNAQRAMGDYLAARPLILAALEGLADGQVPDVEIIADIHSFAGSLASDDSAFDQAIDHLETAANYYLQAVHSEGMLRTTMQLGSLYGLTGDYQAAIRVERAAFASLDPEHRFYLPLLINLAMHFQAAGQPRAARNVLDLETRRLDELPEALRVRVTWLHARLALDGGDPATAEALLDVVRNHFARHPDPFDFAHASLELAQIYHRQSRLDELATVAGEALQLFSANAHGQDALAALTMVQRAAAARALTAERLQRAIRLFESGGRRRA